MMTSKAIGVNIMAQNQKLSIQMEFRPYHLKPILDPRFMGEFVRIF